MFESPAFPQNFVNFFLFHAVFSHLVGYIYKIMYNFAIKRTNMKKNYLLVMSAAMMLAIGLSSCSSDDEVSVFSKECLYEPQCISPVDVLETATTPEGWTITTYGGTLTKAEFNSQPPASPEQFFSKMLKMTESNMLKFSNSLKNSQVNYANYYQFYLGTFIPNTGYLCHFDNNDKLTKIEGVFAPIEGLNITPSISSDEADSIFSRFLNKKIKGSMLQITPFYKDGNIDVRLTYIINDYIGCFVHYRCFVDAHSGEVLLSEFP